MSEEVEKTEIRDRERDLAMEKFLYLCAGYTGKIEDLYDDTKDRLIRGGVARAIAELTKSCALLNGTSFDKIITEAKVIFDKEHDAEYAWVSRLWLTSGGDFLDTHENKIRVHCSDRDQIDMLTSDLEGERIEYCIEPGEESFGGYIVVIERGFLTREDEAA